MIRSIAVAWMAVFVLGLPAASNTQGRTGWGVSASAGGNHLFR